MISTIEEEVIEKLLVNKQRILEKLEIGEPVPQLPPWIEVNELSENQKSTIIIKDTILYDPIEKEPEPFIEVTSIENIGGKSWRITLRQVILEPQDYWSTIGISLAVVLIILLSGLFIVNRFISRKLWRSFYQGLSYLKNFSLQEVKPIALEPSSISEFKELNEAIIKLTEKVRSDYYALKEFTENASHEIQTPLSIIQSKLELLVQSPNLEENDVEQLKSALSGTQRLSKLNQSLLLLTKIGNNQFPETQTVSLSQAIEKQIINLEEFIHAKNLTIEKQLIPDQTVTANDLLVDVLLANLLSNAIKYNSVGGIIRIKLQDHVLSVSNNGKQLSVAPEKMFERFKKADSSFDSLGLGLAIVKEICEINSWRVSYSVQDGWHILKVTF
jgi:signal transduction histidine kinase